MKLVRALLLISILGNALHTGAQSSRLVDSVLAVPYDDLVRDLPRSHRTLERAMSEALANGSRLDQGRLHSSFAIVHHLWGQWDSAAYHGLQAAQLYREEGDRVRLGDALCTLGHEVKRSDLQQAFTYYRQGLAILEEEKADSLLTGCYDNFGVVHEMGGARDSALFYYRRALALKEQLNDSVGIPYSLNKIAVVLLPERKFEEALALMDRAGAIRVRINDHMGLAEQSAYFGDVYQAWGRYPEAVKHFERSLLAGKNLAVPYLTQYCYERLAECHEAVGDHHAALTATKNALAIKDSIQGEGTMRTILELKERFNASEKDREIALLGERAARRQAYVWISTIALALVVVVGLLIHQTRQRRLRAEQDAAIIAAREAGLKAVFEATEIERTRLARELHDGIGQQLGGLKHRLEAVRDRVPIADVIAIVDDTSREVRDLAHQMMPRALTRLGLVPAMAEMVERTFAASEVKASFEHVGMDAAVRPELETGLYRMAQELLNNILKHAHARTVEVQLLRNRQYVVLLVQDDGRGFDRSTNGDGIGLMNISDRSRTLGGTFELESARGNGTLATIRIPVEQTIL